MFDENKADCIPVDWVDAAELCTLPSSSLVLTYPIIKTIGTYLVLYRNPV